MVKIVGVPFVFWIGSVWTGAWTALLIVGFLSLIFFGLAMEAAVRQKRDGRNRDPSGLGPVADGLADPVP